MAKSKDQNKSLETNPKEIETYELSEKEFKIASIKMLNELKGNTTHDKMKSSKQCMNKVRISAKREKQ